MKLKQTTVSFIFLAIIFAYPSRKDFSDAFIKVADKGNPTVVSIISEKVVERNTHYFFERFDDRLPQGRQKGHSLGSGVIIDAGIVWCLVFRYSNLYCIMVYQVKTN